jgi:hypothetical protein
MESVDTLVLRDAILSEFIELCRSIPKMSGNVIGNGIYEQRQTLLRILERLDKRPHQSSGRSTMVIDDERLTVGEVEVIEYVITKLMACDNKELLRRMKPSGATMHVSLRRESMERLIKYVVDAKGMHKPRPVAAAA